MLTAIDFPDYETTEPFDSQEEYLDCLLNGFARFLLNYQKECAEMTGAASTLIPIGYAALAELKQTCQSRSQFPHTSHTERVTPAVFFKKIRKRLLTSPSMPLRQICDRLYLDDFGIFCLTGAVAFSLDSVYSRIMADSDGFPADLLARIFFDEAYRSHGQFPHLQHTLKALSPVICLRKPDPDISVRLKADSALMAFLYDPNAENSLLKSCCFYTSPDEELSVPIANQDILTDLTDAALHGQKQFLIRGDEGSGRRYFVKHLCARLNFPCLFIDSESFFSLDEHALERSVWELARECFLKEICCCFYNLSAKENQPLTHYQTVFSQIIPLTPLFAVTTRQTDLNFTQSHSSGVLLQMLVQDLPLPDASVRGKLLISYLRRERLEDRVSLQELANTFSFTPGQLLSAVSFARNEQKMEPEGAPMKASRLLGGFRHTLEHSLSQKATRIPACFTMEDLVLPPEQTGQLLTACSYIRYSNTVYDNWNFSSKIVYGKGTSLLFYGPPGTGKTMTAQVIASQLGLELYRIDLSRIADKYVGETEKNLAFIFEQAKKGSAILFFDEADALFGKRSQVSSSNDKYSNMETSFLLQCMEDYDGISILATNNKQNIDPAFYRRIRFFISFPMPDASMRLAIWKKSFPESCPLESGIPFEDLAETFELSGANIKNISLNAAFYAAARNTSVTLACIVNSIYSEYMKTNPVSGRDCVNPYTHLLW